MGPQSFADGVLENVQSRAQRLAFFALVALALLAKVHPSYAVDPAWSALGPNAATVFALERDQNNDSVMYAGTFFGGLNKSVDAGATWQPLAGPLSATAVFSVAIDPSNPAIVYAGTFNLGVYKSLDAGISWAPVNSGLAVDGLQIESIAIDSHAPAVLMIATQQGVFRSQDAGGTWTKTGGALSALPVKTLVFEGGVIGLVYAGTSGKGVFRSVDGGQTWAAFTVGIGQQNITRLNRDPVTRTIFAATVVGGFQLLVGDTQWRDISYNLAGTKVNHILRAPQNNTLLAATDAGTYRLTVTNGVTVSWTPWSDAKSAQLSVNMQSGRIHIATIFRSFVYTDDFGTTFKSATEGIHNVFVGAIENLDYNGTSLLYVGSESGVQIGAERSRSDLAPPWFVDYPFPGAIFDVVKHPTVAGRLFAGSEVGGIWRSDYWGLHWVSSSTGIVPARITALTQATTTGTPLYAATSSGLAISYDDGKNWSMRKISDTSPLVTAAVADPDRPGHAFFGTNDGRLFRTIDFGNNFLMTSVLPDGSAVRMLEAARFANLYAVSGSGKLSISQDIGVTFFAAGADILHSILTVASDPAHPWIAYAGTIGGGVYKTESNGITWQTRNAGIDVPYIASFAIDPRATDTVYAGAKGVVYRSTDAGTRWIKMAGILPAQLVNALRLDPTSGALFASVELSGIFKSLDGGATWTRVLNGNGFGGQAPIELSKVSANTLFAGSIGEGVYRSSDAGATWEHSSKGMGLFVRSLAIDSSQPDTMYATSIGAGIFKSVDGGANWVSKGLRNGNLLNVAIDKSTPPRIYAASSVGLARSLDAGETWENVGFRAPYIFDLALDPSNPGRLIAAGTGGKAYQSTSNGTGWSELSDTGLPGENFTALAIHPSNGAILLGTENSGIYRLSAGATAWEPLGPTGLPTHSVVSSITIEPKHNAIYVTTTAGGAFASLDNGVNWIPLTAGIPGQAVSSLTYDPFDTQRLFMAIYNNDATKSGLYASSDAGVSWKPLLFPGVTGRTVAFSNLVVGQVFAASEHQIARSSNGGRDWTMVSANFGSGSISALSVDSNAPNVVYVGTSTGALFVSTNGGGTWIQRTLAKAVPIGNIRSGKSAGEIYLATHGDGVVRSLNAGASWSLGASRGLFALPVLFLATHPSNPQIIYAATGGQGMYKSTDAGTHWDQINTGLDSKFLLTLAIDNTAPETLFVGTAGAGVYISENGGASWRAFNTQLSHLYVTSIRINRLDHTVVYVGTEGGGVFKVLR